MQTPVFYMLQGWYRAVGESRSGGGGSRKVGGRFSNLHTPSKNPPSISGIQAYIAYLLVGIFCELRLYGVLRSSQRVSLDGIMFAVEDRVNPLQS
jgi:hypothetical protein